MTLNGVALSLEVLIQELRDELRAEIPLRVTARAVPVLRDRDGLPTKKDADEGGLGPPLSAPMWRYLGHPESWGTTRLAMSSILEASEWCAARHPAHRRPLFIRSLCGELVYQAAYLSQEVDDLVWLHSDLSIDQIRGMLTAALNHSREWRVNRFARLTKEPGVAQPYPERRPIRPAA